MAFLKVLPRFQLVLQLQNEGFIALKVDVADGNIPFSIDLESIDLYNLKAGSEDNCFVSKTER